MKINKTNMLHGDNKSSRAVFKIGYKKINIETYKKVKKIISRKDLYFITNYTREKKQRTLFLKADCITPVDAEIKMLYMFEKYKDEVPFLKDIWNRIVWN